MNQIFVVEDDKEARAVRRFLKSLFNHGIEEIPTLSRVISANELKSLRAEFEPPQKAM